jgi:N utilization substance protein A
MKGSRVQSIIRELRGEKIDIIEFSDDLVTFAQSALAPAKITRVSVTHHGEFPHLDVIVEDEQLSLAIGKRGQNVRLASELISCRIDIKSETDVKDEVADALAKMLQDAIAESDLPLDDMEVAEGIDWSQVPGIDEDLAGALQEAGFSSLEAILGAEPEALLDVPGIDEETAADLKEWALSLTAEPAEEPEEEASLGNDEFMAALSKALKESEIPEEPSDQDPGTVAES